MNSEIVIANEKKFFEYVNNRDTIAMDRWINEFVDDDFINHNPALGVSPDKEGLKQMFLKLFELFPDFAITIKEIVFENDVLFFRNIIHGMKENEGINGIAMVKFKNGKAVDRWAITEPI